MQSWIWIWYICLNYSLQKIICLKPTTPEGRDWFISIPKCNKSRGQGKILAEREAKLEQGLGSTIRKEPYRTPKSVELQNEYEKVQSWRHWAANTSYTEADNNLQKVYFQNWQKLEISIVVLYPYITYLSHKKRKMLCCPSNFWKVRSV